MRTMKVEPTNEQLTGYAEIKMMPYAERLKVIQQHKLADDKVDNIAKGLRVESIVKSHIEKLDITFSNGEKATDFEDLGYYREGVEFINEIGTTLLQGVQLGEDEKKD